MAALPAAAETRVGRWCDDAGAVPGTPAIIEIAHTDAGAFEARLTLADGTRLVRALDGPYEFSFPVTGSPSAEFYEVLPEGDLYLGGGAGPYRKARPLDDGASPGDCLGTG